MSFVDSLTSCCQDFSPVVQKGGEAVSPQSSRSLLPPPLLLFFFKWGDTQWPRTSSVAGEVRGAGDYS